jgi:hypothetical protein
MLGRLRWLIVVGALLLAGLPATAGAVAPPGEPKVEPVEFTSTGVKLKGALNPEGVPNYYSFAYKEAGAVECEEEWGCAPTTQRNGPLTGSAPQEVSAEVQFARLRPGKTYIYWLLVENEAGMRRSRSSTGLFVVPGPQGKAPVIESVKVTHLTKTDATLEATIDTEGLETEYAFGMISSPCSKKGFGCELIVLVKLPCCGRLFGSSVPQTVSLDLNSAGVELGGGEYVFGIAASNEAGGASASGGMFEAPEEVAVAMPEKEVVVKPLGSGLTPGPAGNEPEAPPASGQHSASGASSSSAPAGGATPATVSLKPAHGKPSAKHGKRRKLEHHAKRSGRGHKRKKH